MALNDFEDLVCWRLANELKLEVIAFTAREPAKSDFRFCNQIRDCSASSTANIAEGFGRFLPGEFARFLGWARGSMMETIDRLGDARERGYIDPRTHDRLANLARAALRATTGLMRLKQRQAAARRNSRGRPSH